MSFKIGDDVMVLQAGPDKGKTGKIVRRIADSFKIGSSYDVSIEDAKEIRFMESELIAITIQKNSKRWVVVFKDFHNDEYEVTGAVELEDGFLLLSDKYGQVFRGINKDEILCFYKV